MTTKRKMERSKFAYDMRMNGKKLDEIGHDLGISRERARQLSIFYAVKEIGIANCADAIEAFRKARKAS